MELYWVSYADKTAIVNKFKKENNLDYNLDEIIVSSGYICKQSIFNFLQVIIDHGDEVIIKLSTILGILCRYG